MAHCKGYLGKGASKSFQEAHLITLKIRMTKKVRQLYTTLKNVLVSTFPW